MKEVVEKSIEQRVKDDAMMNFVSRQAQEAILDPNLPESYKDDVLNAAIGTIQKIAEGENVYDTADFKSQQLKQLSIIYETEGKTRQKRRKTPRIVEEINKNLGEGFAEDEGAPTVEGVAQKVGMSKRVLYRWVRSNPEFVESLEKLKTVQKEDPFKTGLSEDGQVNLMALAFLLLETQLRAHKNKPKQFGAKW